MGVTGRAVVAALRQRGWSVEAVDDRPSDAMRSAASELGVQLHESPGASELAELARRTELVVVSPGLPPSHPVFHIEGVDPVSEIELGSRWVEVPMVAVTGTNGKTTVVSLVAAMLERSGRRSVAAGNIGLPLVEAAGKDADVLVVEVSSFQLALSFTFHPAVSVWLNLAPDHLDWHPDLDDYAAAKARIWANQGPGDAVVVNDSDPAVMGAVQGVPAGVRLIGFGTERSDFRVESGYLAGPDGVLLAVGELPRRLPHDIDNSLAAAAAAMAAGANRDSCADVLRSFAGLPHRVQLVATVDGIGYYDDSKATTPASVRAALAGFDSVVLIAGGQNKGLDFSVLGADAERLRAVVAIGEAAGEVEAALGQHAVVTRAASMEEAVKLATDAARPGDAVLLSPGGASFDWYRNYAERGDDFARCVAGLGARR
jgi:UDP-N-acetylmuramoylalanine--D-glutamate ligase